MTVDRPARTRTMPPHVVDSFRDLTPAVSEAELLHRLEGALAALPAAERAAVVAAVGYDEGAVGAAMEVEVDTDLGHELAQRGLAMLRQALADLDPDADPAQD